MGFKDLLVLVGNGSEGSGRFGLAFAAAAGASVTAAVPVTDVAVPVLPAELPQEFLVRIQAEAEAAAAKAIDAFSREASEARLEAEIRRFSTAAGTVGQALSRIARCFDALVLPQPDPSAARGSEIVETCLFGAGRPLLIVPFIPVRAEIRTVLVAWDGGLPAARAVADALPILQRARRVEVVTFQTRNGAPPDATDADLVRHLARHDIRAERKSFPIDEIDVANMLLSYAADAGADMIVMGGYGHSRMREVVLGGTTREILRSMTVPVLMSH
jgi:nucleotide-binding universal stress UspA family protein